jgi:hypothetical protein
MKLFLWFMYNFGLTLSLCLTTYMLGYILVIYKVNLLIILIICLGLSFIWPKQVSREEFMKDDELPK